MLYSALLTVTVHTVHPASPVLLHSRATNNSTMQVEHSVHGTLLEERLYKLCVARHASSNTSVTLAHEFEFLH